MSEIIVRELTIVSEIPAEEAELRCTLCGWVIEDPALATFTNDTDAIHYDRTCPKGDTKPAPKKTRKPAAKKPERVLAEGAGIVVKEMKIVGVRGAHAECDHPATKSDRAACRKRNAAK